MCTWQVKNIIKKSFTWSLYKKTKNLVFLNGNDITTYHYDF